MTNAVSTEVKTKDINIFSPENFNHYMTVAETLSKTNMIPKNYIGKPGDIVVAIQWGMSLGLPMMQALQSIAVINGRPSLYGDSLLAVVQGHPAFEWIREEPIIDNDNVVGYLCTVKRKNSEPHTMRYTIDDAKKASLWGKQGPWSQYPNRMLQMRARGFALRDTFADALLGIQSAEECQDLIDVTPEASKENAKNELQNLMKQKKVEVSPKIKVINPEPPDDTSRIQLVEKVEELLIATEFQPERLQKALAHYKATDIEQMSREQLHDFIGILNKELMKLAEIESELSGVDPETGEILG